MRGERRGGVGTGACVGVEHGDAFLACGVLEETLLGAVVPRAG